MSLVLTTVPPQQPTHLCIICPCGNQRPIRAVCRTTNIKKVPLLSQHVPLTRPLPHQQLAQARTAESQPVPVAVECCCCDALLAYREGLEGVELWQLVQLKEAVAETCISMDKGKVVTDVVSES